MTDRTHPAPATRRQPRGAKKLLFVAMALALPLVLVLAVELALRLAGFGGYPPTFVRVATLPAGDLHLTNPKSSRSFFFKNPQLSGQFSETDFLLPKPAGTVRVVLIGGSAIKGYPQPRGFAVSAFLEAMLTDAWPGRRVEVINLGTTAVASYPALELATDALAIDPDLMVVYSGHNEFFGAFGVASLNRVGATPQAIRFQRWARSLAVVQATASVLRSAAPVAEDNRNLMQTMIGQAFVAPDSPLRQRAADLLRANVSTMIRRAKAAGVPTIVCTLPSNERGIAPVGASELPALSDADRERVLRALERADTELEGSLGAMRDELAWAARLAPQHARVIWLLARAHHDSGEPDEAAPLFQRALDLDSMPWRATSIQNDAIAAAATEGGAILADVQRVFRDASAGGAVSWRLMDDHVHMSLEGQDLVARTVVAAMAGMDPPLRVTADQAAGIRPFEAIAAALSDNIYDRFAISIRLAGLFRAPFYAETNAHALRLMERRANELLAQAPPRVAAAARSWTDPRMHLNYARPIGAVTGPALLELGMDEEAERVLAAATHAVRPYGSASLEFTHHRIVARARRLGELDAHARDLARAAIGRADVLIEHTSPVEPRVYHYAGAMSAMLGDHDRAVELLLEARLGVANMQLVVVDRLLVRSLFALNRHDEALGLIERGLAVSGPFRPHYEQMGSWVEGRDAADGADGAESTIPEIRSQHEQ